MATQEDYFFISGPAHLIYALDWQNPHHKRSVMACLVKGAYVLEKERQQGTALIAPPWWLSFGFRLHQYIRDVDHSYIGAIYQHVAPLPFHAHAHAPAYVVAFRGTILEGDTLYPDMAHDLCLAVHMLQETPRSAIAIEAVMQTVAECGSSNVWLAGHSLGSSMAMLAGKHMMRRQNIPLKCYLFNPPFISLPIELIESETIKQLILFGKSIGKFAIRHAMRISYPFNLDMDPFLELLPWHPHLFVHGQDHISSGYISYFDHRLWMEDLGLGPIERVAAQHSIVRLLWNADQVQSEKEPLHLIPSANLTVNHTPMLSFKAAHSLQQWWSSLDSAMDLIPYRME